MSGIIINSKNVNRFTVLMSNILNEFITNSGVIYN